MGRKPKTREDLCKQKSVKSLPAVRGPQRSSPGSERSPGRARRLTPGFLPRESHEQRSLEGLPSRRSQSQTPLKWLSTQALPHSPWQSCLLPSFHPPSMCWGPRFLCQGLPSIGSTKLSAGLGSFFPYVTDSSSVSFHRKHNWSPHQPPFLPLITNFPFWQHHLFVRFAWRHSQYSPLPPVIPRSCTYHPGPLSHIHHLFLSLPSGLCQSSCHTGGLCYSLAPSEQHWKTSNSLNSFTLPRPHGSDYNLSCVIIRVQVKATLCWW